MTVTVSSKTAKAWKRGARPFVALIAPVSDPSVPRKNVNVAMRTASDGDFVLPTVWTTVTLLATYSGVVNKSPRC